MWQARLPHPVQAPSQANMVQCDAALNSLFGEKVIKMSSLSARVAPLLKPCARPVLEYTIGCNTSLP